MSSDSPFMAVLADETGRDFANQLCSALGYPAGDIVVGTPIDALETLKQRPVAPTYLMVDIGERGFEILPELDAMAEYCHADTRAVVMGSVNDVSFYRELRQRGVIEYFTRPAKLSDIRNALVYDNDAPKAAGKSSVISFMSAASGDGASTVALNTAYCLAKDYRQSTVVIDMDYQYGMVARSLDLSSPFGIRELFEHPDRGIDATLLDRMLVEYSENLKVIAAPNDLRFWPEVRPEVIRDLIGTLQQRFDFIIIDLPHIWSSWVAAAVGSAAQNVLVAQLWLRSVTHTARIISSWRDVGVDDTKVSVVVNRSGAKFKEAISSRDFERVCGKKIDFYLANDIKTIVAAENQGTTVPEVGLTVLGRQFHELAGELLTRHKGEIRPTARAMQGIAPINETSRKSPLSSFASVFHKK